MSKDYPEVGPAGALRGGDLGRNRSEVVDRMVVCEGGEIVVKAPVNTQDGSECSIHLPGGVVERDALRDVLFHLLTALSFDIQDRFRVSRRLDGDSGTAKTPPYLPDVMIGPNLAGHIKQTAPERGKSG